jgi:monofunctional biosynthetic peptidoglycan transglycosylase
MQKPKKFTFIGFIKLIFKIIVLFILGSVFLVAVYTVINPPITPLMLIRPIEGIFQGKFVGIDKDWVDYEEISPNLLRAVISAEDGKFLRHDGFDWNAIKRARRINTMRKGKKIIGASTISMQTSKNVFLWQGRNYIRKGLEAYFTILIEAIWGKKRILEIYVNSIEWGNGIYGVEAASQQYFKKSAKTITKREAALLAAVLPNPRKWSPAAPTGYIKQRSNGIQARMGGIALP